MIDRTYGHLASDAEAYERELLDAYDRRESGGRSRTMSPAPTSPSPSDGSRVRPVRWFHSKRREQRQAREAACRRRAQLTAEELAEMIRTRARTEGVSSAGEPGPLARGIATLAERDRDILVLVSEGKSRSEIAHDLWRDQQTIKKDLERILGCLPDPEEDAEALLGVLRAARKRQREDVAERRRAKTETFGRGVGTESGD
jgi:hypothetical protein